MHMTFPNSSTNIPRKTHGIVQGMEPGMQECNGWPITFYDQCLPTVLLWQSIKQIQQWITNSKNHMQAQQKAATLQACLHTPDIWAYFSKPNQQQELNINEKNLL